ncbi:MAG: adenylate/guanylate cyclase domain-containing protein [Granulosicoccus sp.]|nr:adenylate/guanylate cyclase domain-containing protein [Granulosicoccus sp.]
MVDRNTYNLEKAFKSAFGGVGKFLISKHVWLSSGKEFNSLPNIVRQSIERQQNSSERLIGWIQLSILIIFAILYSAAPKTLPGNAVFEPVPIFLSAYFLFTCMRLYFAYKNDLNFWMLVLSVLADMGLLIGLIWSFHLQYMQPPSFYLKAPTLLYIFIFISLRALRFEPGFVLLSGIVGASGWLLLLGLAVFSDTGEAIVTRDYVQYLTSNRVLVGGEIDKIISILVVTLILTIAIARGRKLLIQSIVDGNTAQSLSYFVPESVASRIAKSDGPLIDTQTETREATILFVDLVSFTSLAERLTPAELIATLNAYFRVISEPIEANGGVINQFQGDAILASFNLPSANPDHASNAVSAALEIERLLALHEFANGVKLKTRAGVNTGTVIGGFVGTPDRLSYTVYGDDVNVAARLQELSKEKNTSNLVSHRTKELCDPAAYTFIPNGSEIPRGRRTPVNVYEAFKK